METTRREFVAKAGLALAAPAVIRSSAFGADGTPAKRPPIKIGQIGTGNQHAYKLGTLRRLTELFEVVGVAGDDPGALGKAPKGECYQGLKWMSHDELLAVPGLQAVAVETEERLPIPVALRCVRAGKHIHLDKPCGESLPAFKTLLDEAKAKDLTVQVGYMYRNNPAVQFCIKAVREGLIGKVFDLDAAMSRHDGDTYRKLIGTYRGGAPYIFACHLIDLAVTLMGEPERVRPFLRRTRPDGVLDNSLTVLEFPQDRLATIRISITEAQGFQRRHLTVFGDKGTITVQPLEVKGNMSGGAVSLALEEEHGGYRKGVQNVEMPPPKDRYEDQWREFAAVLNGESANPYTYEHDYTVHKCHLEACGLPLDV